MQKVSRALDNAYRWYEWWAERYNKTLDCTFLQTSRWGQKSLAQFYGWFTPYEDAPNVTAKLESAKLWAVYAWDCRIGQLVTGALRAQLNKQAVARLRKIEKKLIEWQTKINNAELF